MERTFKKICEYTYTLNQDEVRSALIDKVQTSTWGEDGVTGTAMGDSEIVYHDDGSVSVITRLEDREDTKSD
jgi:hypothetical protein